MVHKIKKPLLLVMRFWGDEPLTSEYIKLRKLAEKKNIPKTLGVELKTRSMKKAVKEAKDIQKDVDRMPYTFFEGYSGVVIRGNKPVKVFSSGSRLDPNKNYIRDLKRKLKEDAKARKGMV